MRPSDRYARTVQVMRHAFAPIRAAALAASELDAFACAYVSDALDAAEKWSKDTTETSRRIAAQHAKACEALTLAPLPGRGSAVRQALDHFSRAVVHLIECDAIAAHCAADTARNLVRPR